MAAPLKEAGLSKTGEKQAGGLLLLPEKFRMPLYSQQIRIIRQFHRLHQMVPGISGNLQGGSHAADGLVVHAVHRDGGSAVRQLGQPGAGNDIHLMGKGGIVKWLMVGNGKVRVILGGEILIEVPSQSYVNQLNARQMPRMGFFCSMAIFSSASSRESR